MASHARMPVVYLPHGGGPWPFVQGGLGEPAVLARLAAYIRSLAQLPAEPPSALLVISAHWEEAVPTVMTAERPPLLFDYYGFPPETYTLTWPAPGNPALAARVQALLRSAGIASGSDATRGFDHGTFVPLKLAYPDADLPTVQLSLKLGLDPAEHLAIGRALAPLRNEGVYILGSGMSYHNMRGFGGHGGAAQQSLEFDRWLGETMTLPRAERERGLLAWASAPSARASHPREEHLLPAMVVAGAAGDDHAKIGYHDTLMGVTISSYEFS